MIENKARKMQLQWTVVVSVFIATTYEQDLKVISKTHTTYLDRYIGYKDVVLMHFTVVADIPYVSFKFEADEMDLTIFGCKPQNVSIFLKHGSPPVINPDGSKYPEGFLNDNRDIHFLQYKSDKTLHYINISSPVPGPYFIAAFLSYKDPREEGITQAGLTPECFTFVDATLRTVLANSADILTSNEDFNISLKSNSSKICKFYVPDATDHAVVILRNITFCKSCTILKIRTQALTVPSSDSYLNKIELNKHDYDDNSYYFRMWTEEKSWHYIDFFFEEAESNITENYSSNNFFLSVKLFSSLLVFPNITEEQNEAKNKTALELNVSQIYTNSVNKKYRSHSLDYHIPFKQYDLVRDSNSESFLFSYDLVPSENGFAPVSINLTSEDFTVLKFFVNEFSDVGGTLQFILAFKPRITSGYYIQKEPKNHVVVGCFRNRIREIPRWPNKCEHNLERTVSSVVLNSSVNNASTYVPFPEAGWWFATFKLFCGGCEPCVCSTECKEEFRKCTESCEINCKHNTTCNNCSDQCEEIIISRKECKTCNCEGPCRRTPDTCNASVVFDISSYPCLSGRCGNNGRCVLMVSEGIVYSTCVCLNNYRGWDCSDDTHANSYAEVVVELLLLVLSNVMFLPAVYVAMHRKFYTETVVYLCTCLFSALYHACDSGENIISFCMVRLSVLQFSDFYCGLLSIWMTLIAMAYLSQPWNSILHIMGAVALAFGTAYNKRSLWVFMFPAVTGFVIMGVSWYLKYKITGYLFPSKRYWSFVLPTGLCVVIISLLMYALLQTQANYKYLHSLWHVLMALGIIILLPSKRSFLPINYEED